VGGGYEIDYLPGSSPGAAAAAAQEAAAAADQLLSGLEGPLSEQDLLIIRHILKAAEAAAVQECRLRRASSSHISLAQLLQAYETVLPQHGLLPQEDTHYYRILLKLGLDPNHDWWQRFHKERQAWSR
jgi:protein SFI1